MMEKLDLDKLDASLVSGNLQSRTKHFKNGPGKGENIHTSGKYLQTLLKGVII